MNFNFMPIVSRLARLASSWRLMASGKLGAKNERGGCIVRQDEMAAAGVIGDSKLNERGKGKGFDGCSVESSGC